MQVTTFYFSLPFSAHRSFHYLGIEDFKNYLAVRDRIRTNAINLSAVNIIIIKNSLKLLMHSTLVIPAWHGCAWTEMSSLIPIEISRAYLLLSLMRMVKDYTDFSQYQTGGWNFLINITTWQNSKSLPTIKSALSSWRFQKTR